MKKDEKNSDIEDSLGKFIKKKMFSPLDVVESNLSYKGFTKTGNLRCSVCISDFAKAIYECLKRCKHPTLNPTIDDIYDLKKPGESGLDSIETYIHVFGEFSSQPLDKSKDYLEIVVPFKFLFVNGTSFIEEEKFKVKDGAVQTALFRKVID